jgi:hypothetical protein
MLKIIKVLINKKTKRKKKYSFCECDNCHVTFETKKLIKNFNKLTFCSRKCYDESFKFGIAKEQREQNYLKKHGVKQPFGNQDVINKRKKHIQEKYGVHNVC